MKILLAATFAILLLLLLAIGGGVAVFLKSKFGESGLRHVHLTYDNHPNPIHPRIALKTASHD